jgi:hypothetical protein
MDGDKVQDARQQIVYRHNSPSLEQVSNIVHRPYFTHCPDKQRPFLLIEVDIADGRALDVLLSQVLRQEDRETLLDDFDALDGLHQGA